jgi:hypothetical protein
MGYVYKNIQLIAYIKTGNLAVILDILNFVRSIFEFISHIYPNMNRIYRPSLRLIITNTVILTRKVIILIII